LNGRADPHLLHTIRGVLVPIHPAGYPFIGVFAVVTVILFMIWEPLGWLGVLATAWCIYFFRHPPRVTPNRPDLVVAPADGVVILAADHPFTLEGNLLMIDHGMGLNTAFMHLSRIDVKLGERVRRGQPVGAVGRSGRATGPHLHWSLKWRDARIDPLLVAGPMPTAD